MPTDPKIDTLHHQLFEEGLKVCWEDPWRRVHGPGYPQRQHLPPERGSLASGSHLPFLSVPLLY